MKEIEEEREISMTYIFCELKVDKCPYNPKQSIDVIQSIKIPMLLITELEKSNPKIYGSTRNTK